jgi:DNA-directed RNA polymerase subunit beta
VDYIDVSPKQLVSVAASLVPFLEHDDANRALMGANMQRQSVPLLVAEAPLVGTGMEGVTARDSGAVILAKRNGIVDSVDSERIIVRVEGEHHPTQLVARGGLRHLSAHQVQALQPEHLHQSEAGRPRGRPRAQGSGHRRRPLHRAGRAGAGPQRAGGLHALARLQLRGRDPDQREAGARGLLHLGAYRGVRDRARDTKLGPEEITRDIPNVSEHALRDLDESGVIRIGAQIKHGDILVGKVTPKGETQLTPEEKLLRAIFGEKAGDVRDASLTCPPGIEGTVVDVRIFSRKGQEKDERAKLIEAEYVAKLEKNLGDEIRILTDERLKRLEASWAARKCWPTCTTSAPTSAC